MPVRVTRGQAGNWKQKALRAKSRLERISKEASRTVETLVRTSEISAAAFVAGVVQGRTGGVEVLGVPFDLGAGTALHLLGFVSPAKFSGHLHSFGDGLLASFLTTTGRGVGVSMRQKAATQPAATTGALTGARGNMLTDADRQMAAAAAAI